MIRLLARHMSVLSAYGVRVRDSSWHVIDDSNFPEYWTEREIDPGY